MNLKSRYLFSLLAALLLVAPAKVLSQEFEVPRGYSFATAADFAKYEGDILRCIDFLEKTPLDSNVAKRREANAFLVKWLTGTPKVNVDLLPYAAELSRKNKDFLIIYLGGWVRQALLHPDAASKLQCNMAALESVLRVYKTGRGVVRDENIQNLVELEKDGKLEAWVAEQVEQKQ